MYTEANAISMQKSLEKSSSKVKPDCVLFAKNGGCK